VIGGKKRALYAVGAIAFGLAYWWVVTHFWGFWANFNPIADALLQPGNVYPHYRWILHPTDWLTSVLVSAPFAWVLVRFAGRHLWSCVALASASCFLTVYWPEVAESPAFLWAVIRGLLVQLTFLPASVALVLWARRRFAPNNSSKPTPLRGAA
jgi:hypothetical protein